MSINELEKHYIEDITVLVVEDDESSLNLMTSLLRDIFTNVKLATNGKEALDIFNSQEIHLVITDVNMPVMTGIELAKEIRKKDKDIPIIFVTAYNDADYILESIKYSIDGYILKPIAVDNFMEILNKVIEKIKLKREKENLIWVLKQYQNAIEDFFIISKSDEKGRIKYINQKFEEISGFSQEEVIGKNNRLLKEQTEGGIKEAPWQIITKGKKWSGVIRSVSKSGEPYYVKTTIFPIKDRSGKIHEYLSIKQDITDVINPKNVIKLSLNPEKQYFVAIFKIENFEDIEDLYDFEIIERLENSIYQFIKENISKDCQVKDILNLGSGEFALLKEFESSPSEKEIDKLIKEVEDIQKKLQDTNSFELEHSLITKTSIAYGFNAFRLAKYGVQKLKDLQSDILIVNHIQDNIKKQAEEKLSIIKTVKDAINENKVIVYYQPIVNNNTGKTEKYEALVRIIDENGKILSPVYFLDIIKKTKYYFDITKQVIFQAFKAQKLLRKKISINLSSLDIENPEIREFIYKTLEKVKNTAEQVSFEIVETEDLRNKDVVDEFLNRIKLFGAKVSIDDFGSGYSNLERIVNYKPDYIKIDGGLIRRIKKDSVAFNLVIGIVDFCKRENFKTIAEFVENEKIYKIIKDIGIDYSQGYYFGKPQTLEQILSREQEDGKGLSS